MIDVRVGRLEDDFRELRGDMKAAVKDLSYLRGRVEHLPTTWVLITTVIASQITLLGFVFTILRFVMGAQH